MSTAFSRWTVRLTHIMEVLYIRIESITLRLFSLVFWSLALPHSVIILFNIVVILAIKLIQINTFDQVKAFYCKQNGKGKFNLTNFILFNLMWLTLLCGHFYFFNLIYFGQTEPCFGIKLFMKVFHKTLFMVLRIT